MASARSADLMAALEGGFWVLGIGCHYTMVLRSLRRLIATPGQQRRADLAASGSPSGSTLITSAPKADISVAAAGAATKLAQSITLRPSNRPSPKALPPLQP